MIETLAVLLIIAFLAYKMYGGYFRKTTGATPGNSSSAMDNDIDISNPSATVNAAREKVNEINKKTSERDKQIQDIGL